MDNRVLAKDDDLSRRRNHERRRHGTRALALELEAVRQQRIAIDMEAVGGAIATTDTVGHV